MLYGVSVFARRPGVRPDEVLDRFPQAPSYLEVSVGVLRGADLEALPTGENPDHFDIQLVRGVTEDDEPVASFDLVSAARRLLAAAGELHPNPSYAGDTDEMSEHEEER